MKPDSHESCRHSNPERHLNPRLRVSEPAAGGHEALQNVPFCSNGDVTPRVCGFLVVVQHGHCTGSSRKCECFRGLCARPSWPADCPPEGGHGVSLPCPAAGAGG